MNKNTNIITKKLIDENITGYININLIGGLCNQIFQIVVGYVLCLKYNKQLIIKSIQSNPHSNINYFNNIFRKINNNLKINCDNYYLFNEPRNSALLYFDIPNYPNIELFGYFQNEKYFINYRKNILKLLEIEDERKNKLISQYTDLSNSYFIHIRRGDYINHDLHMIDLDNYYRQSITYIKSRDPNAIFYVFSNDIEYCQMIEWLTDNNVKYITDLDEIDSLYLMSMCTKGGIGCNSSYSWWGGYLNENIDKLIIYPNKWFNSDWDVDIGFVDCMIMNIIDYTIEKKI